MSDDFYSRLIQGVTGKRKQPLVGIDIGTSAVRLVIVSKTSHGDALLECAATEPLPRGAVTNNGIENLQQLSDALRRAWKRSGAQTKNVVLALPPGAVIAKKIQLPEGMTEDELEWHVELEASSLISLPLKEIALDFYVLGVSPTSYEDEEVLLVAARKEKVEDRVAAAEEAGAAVVAVDVVSYAAQAALAFVLSLQKVSFPLLNSNKQQSDHSSQAVSDQLIGLIVIGGQTSHLSILNNKTVIFEREQNFGGEQLTHDLQQRLNLSSWQEAETMKCSGQLFLTNKFAKTDARPLAQEVSQAIIEEYLDSVAGEVSRALQFFFTSTPHTKIHHLFLAGGGANVPDIASVLQSHLQIPTSVLNPFEGMVCGKKVNKNKVFLEAPSYLVACGLALRHLDSERLINLLPHRGEKRAKKKSGFIVAAALSVLLGGMGVFAVGSLFSMQTGNQHTRNQFIEQENTKLDEKIKEISTLHQEINALKARQRAVEDLQEGRNFPVYLLSELVRKLPEGVTLTSMKRQGARVTLNGLAQSNERVSELLRNISRSEWLENADLGEIRATDMKEVREIERRGEKRNFNASQSEQIWRVFQFSMHMDLKQPSSEDE